MSEYETDALMGIEPNYPLVPGEWDIGYKDIDTDTFRIMRYVINQPTPIKDLIREGMKIASAKRMR